MRKKAALLFLILIICSMLTAPANASIEHFFPKENDMGYDVDPDSMLYKKYPVDNYTWDTVHEWFRMEGIKPVTGNSKELILKTGLDYMMSFIIAINRLAIYLLQYGFNNDLLDPILESIDETLAPIKTYFFDQMFGFATLVLAVILIIKFYMGRKGEGFKAILKAVLYTALIIGLITNIGGVISFLGDFCDYTALTVLGTMSFAPLSGSDIADLANQKIIDLSNLIFKLYVEDAWSFGQFTSINDIPTLTKNEYQELSKISELFIQPDQSWKDVFLQVPDGEARKAMVEVFTDPDIPHDPSLNSYMLEHGGSARLLLALVSIFVNIFALGLYGAIGLFQMTGTIGIIVLTVAFCILIVFAFFGDLGEKILRSAIGWWLFLFFFKVAAAMYLGIPIIVMTLLNFNFGDNTYISIIFIHMVINLLSIIFIPTIWKKIMPFLLRVVARTVEMIGNPKGRIQGTFRGSLKEDRVIPPQLRAESLRNNFDKKHYSSQRYRKSKYPEIEEEVMNMGPRQEFKYRKTKDDETRRLKAMQQERQIINEREIGPDGNIKEKQFIQEKTSFAAGEQMRNREEENLHYGKTKPEPDEENTSEFEIVFEKEENQGTKNNENTELITSRKTRLLKDLNKKQNEELVEKLNEHQQEIQQENREHEKQEKAREKIFQERKDRKLTQKTDKVLSEQKKLTKKSKIDLEIKPPSDKKY